ncbi:sulfite exporter TauE/SafE family protein [Ferrovibrio terrae]|uniref:sulfite exporter TauE/SafE family protein n=1 Tax=Ferrovibrio terrae TaxID=2594003 RepID=UPI003137C6D6
MLPDLFPFLIAASGVFLIAFMRGAFGGGFAIVGIPLLSLAMDPITAGAVLAPLFIAIDIVAFFYWRPGTWSKPDAKLLLPMLALGIACGFWLMSILNRHAVEVAMALITLVFAGLWFRSGGQVRQQPRVPAKGLLAGFTAGITTMVAHSGGPPLAMYLLPLGLAKVVYAGTTSLFFTVGNALKAGPWLYLAQPDARTWILMACCLPAAPLGVWLGWRLHERLNQRQLYRICYGLLVVTALKLLWDGLEGFGLSGFLHG